MNPASRTLFAGALDYAGLFPPASLGLAAAVDNYRAYRSGPDAWMLGRFLLPAARLGELDRGLDWPLGAIGSPAHADPRVTAVEMPVATPADIEVAAGLAAHGVMVCCEVALAPATLPARLDALAAHGLAAKVRTGGTTPGAVPPASRLAAFLAGCQTRGLRWKATAGLHHALRASGHHGFLNLLRAALALEAGGGAAEACDELERDPWDGWHCTEAEAVTLRRRFLGWGSCSFEEPLADLRDLGWL